MEGDPEPGETVEILSSQGEWLGTGAYSPASQIRARAWSFNPTETIDGEFFQRRINQAIRARSAWYQEDTTDAYRLVYAESDGLPGLIVDRYGEVLVFQSLSTGIERWKEVILDILVQETGLKDVYERSDADVRNLEGLSPRSGPTRGNPPTTTAIMENGLIFAANFQQGQKTGHYLDQRENHLRVRELAANREVLDCFCYTGGFTVNALAGGAKSVLSIDSSNTAITTCRKNISDNHLSQEKHTALEGDVFQWLRKLRDESRSFDLVILDPPKFAPTAADIKKAARAYKDINLLGLKLLRPGGYLVTFSCSGGVNLGDFQKFVAYAAIDAEAQVQIMETLTQPPDHPIALNFPESAYLKGFICRKS